MTKSRGKTRGLKQHSNGSYHVQFILTPERDAVAIKMLQSALQKDKALHVRTIVSALLMGMEGAGQATMQANADLVERVKNALE